MEQGAGWRTPAPPADPEVETPLAHAARVYETLGALPREDLMTLVCTHDQTGRILSGGSAYRIRLAEAAMPPVNGFWQIYARPAAGPQYRTGIGSRNDLLLNVDGSLELTIQHPLPEAAGISNWLPSPEGEMALVMRLHSPRPAGVEGAWRMPAIERLDPWTRQRRSPRRGRAPTPRSSSSNELAPPGAAKEKVP